MRNAAVVADAALTLAKGGAVGVVPAGERWPDGGLRPAIEDLLGAGAIIDRLGLQCSAEARIARDAYRSAGRDIAELVRTSISGQELIARNFARDVELAVQRDPSATVPILADGAYRHGAAGASLICARSESPG